VKEIQNIYLDRLSSNRLVELADAAHLLPNHLFPVALIPALFCPKEDIYAALLEAGVPVEVGNKPIYKTTAFKDEALSLFGAEEVYKAQLLLPSHHLMSLEEAASVIEIFERILENYGYRGCSF
jgi:UDP-4-amino-4,6-dideoxy-L-N-acetyl-beta-L-altrosamine transaminase